MGSHMPIKQLVKLKYPLLDPDVVLLNLYKELRTCKAVADHLGVSESGVWRRIHELELQAIANGNNGFGK